MADLAESFMGPMLFERLAGDMARRVAALSPAPKQVLETAAGTGIATRQLLAVLPPDAWLRVTDLNPDMLEIARPKLNRHRNVEIRQATIHQSLPF